MTATQEEAALAYDIAAIEHRGLNAVTNFDISHYVNWYRRRRRGDDGLDASETIPVEQPNGLTEHARATTCLDGTVAVAAAFDFADSYIVQLPNDQARMPTSPALDQLLLQSPKFAEIMEQVSVAATTTENNTGPSSPSTSLSSPSSLSQPSPERQPESSRGSGASSSAGCSFPDDVQTYFECDDVMSFAFADEVDTFLFGDLGAYAAPMFQCDLDVLV
jgi:AP2-like factor, ANT lineage